MKVLVVGGGAREHALAVQIASEPGTSVVCAPGNPGIARDVPVAPVEATDPDAVLALAGVLGADLTVIGPEAPLAAGVADRFLQAGRPIFGPTKAAAQLETSKAFAKGIMERHGVPTAAAVVCDTADAALRTLAAGRLGWPVVVKADGLAAGKGVVVAPDLPAAEAAVRAAMLENAFGAAGARVVLEECLSGEELSYFVIAAGDRFVACGSAQDHKRLLDGDLGPNTGGMGAFAPSVLMTDALRARVDREIVTPVLAGMAAEGTPFVGFLYCGLMLTPDGPKVIEFNCRFGDPEAQVVLPLLADPLAPLLLAASTGAALPSRTVFADDVAVGVVLASRGYPGHPEAGQVIRGLERARVEHPGVQLRFAGVARRDGELVTAGGRVLTVVGRAATYAEAADAAYAAADCIEFDGLQRRSDIGARARHALRAVRAMKYAVVTFGCRVNQADSLAVEAALTSAGAEAVPAGQADVVLVNTCSVTASADQGARQTIRRIQRENPGARIVVTGCFASRAPADVAALPGVSLVVANTDKPRLAATLLPMLAPDAPADGPCGRTPAPGLMGRTAWTLRAQTGCGEPCSYCIIPTTRGPSQSRALPEILGELRRVTGAGYKEVALTGVHLGAWGRDLSSSPALADLLGAIAAEPGDFRVRVSSLEPMDCTPAVLEAIAGHPGRFAAHLHLPLQHAANDLLDLMRRPYSIERYAALVDEVRERVPDAAIGSDLIVGFPGETDAHAATLAAYLETSPLTHLHVFPYSDRPGTAAEAMPGKVHGAVVKARAQRLREISRALATRFRAAQTGRVRPALTIDDGRMAVTDNYLRVAVPPGRARNEWIDVVVPPPASDAAAG